MLPGNTHTYTLRVIMCRNLKYRKLNIKKMKTFHPCQDVEAVIDKKRFRFTNLIFFKYSTFLCTHTHRGLSLRASNGYLLDKVSKYYVQTITVIQTLFLFFSFILSLIFILSINYIIYLFCLLDSLLQI